MPGDGARRVFTDQADITCAKREAAVRCLASRMKGEVHLTKKIGDEEAEFLHTWYG